MIIRLPTQDYVKSRDFKCLLSSDHHIGSIHTDHDLIESDLKWARQNKARVFMAGDLFDMILPRDNKRYNPSMYHPALRGKDAVVNAALDLATKILKPYADLIDVIGNGNHETAVTKYHAQDVTALLIERLHTKGHTVRHGGYSGAIVQPFLYRGGAGTSLTIRYHHGTGGSSPVTKGMIDFNRFSTWMRDADVVWCGHKHVRWVAKTAEERIPKSGDKFYIHPILHVLTGSYDGDGHTQFDSDGNYTSDYGIEKAFAPQGRGGVKLHVHITHKMNPSRQVPVVEAIV